MLTTTQAARAGRSWEESPPWSLDLLSLPCSWLHPGAHQDTPAPPASRGIAHETSALPGSATYLSLPEVAGERTGVALARQGLEKAEPLDLGVEFPLAVPCTGGCGGRAFTS